MVGAVKRLFFGLWTRWSGQRGEIFTTSAPMVGSVCPDGRGGVLFSQAAIACAGSFHLPDATEVDATSRRALHWSIGSQVKA